MPEQLDMRLVYANFPEAPGKMRGHSKRKNQVCLCLLGGSSSSMSNFRFLMILSRIVGRDNNKEWR